MQSYQFEQISADPDKPLADGIRPLDTADMERYGDNNPGSRKNVQLSSYFSLLPRNSFIIVSFVVPPKSNKSFSDHLFSRLKDVQTIEELGDVYNHFLLYYGRDIPKMQNAAKANKKRLKKIKEVSEDGTCPTEPLRHIRDDEQMWPYSPTCVTDFDWLPSRRRRGD